MASLNFSIGDVQLYDFEVPEEFGPLGGKQVIYRHEFAGGYISQRSFGNFPEPITWKGYLTGANAISRQQQLDAIRAAGDDVTLSYGGYSFVGKVTRFHAKAKHQYLIPYEIQFWPSQDLSGTGGQSQTFESSDQVLSTESSSFNDIVAGTDGLALPAALATSAAAVQTALQNALLNGDGTVAGILPTDAAAVQAAVQAFQILAAPYAQGTDATAASPAVDAIAWATTIGTTVANVPTSIATLRLINPNLFMLAQQYYGDATQWQAIATASGLQPDPQPIGQFTVTIPQIST